MSVYLDHAATTPMLPEAIDAYTRAMSVVGNPASIHGQGQQARRMLEEAREQIAWSLGADPIEVVFTSGGTEAINLAIKGLYWRRQRDLARPRILVPGGEHHATLDAVEWLEQDAGAQPSWVELDEYGQVTVDAFAEALGRGGAPADGTDEAALGTALGTVLWANNEVGTISPIGQIGSFLAGNGIPLHVDAVSAYGHLPIDFRALSAAGVSALSVSAHKIGGPVGIGALVLPRTVELVPLIHGGGQQRQLRSGTQDVAAAMSFAVAAAHAVESLAAESTRLAGLRDTLIAGVRRVVPDAVLNGSDPSRADPSGADPSSADPSGANPSAATSGSRLDSNAHFTFPGCEGDSLLFLLDVAGVSVSTGSACQAGVPEPSHVLRAMGRSETQARGALRMSLGSTSTVADIDAFLAALPGAYAQASRAGFADRDVSRN